MYYSLNITLESTGERIFTGYFVVNATTHLVTAVYENGNSNNILIPTGTGVPATNPPPPEPPEPDTGFQVYKIGPYGIWNDYTYYDNAYVNGWKQFDFMGLVLSKINYYNSFNNFNIFATTYNSNGHPINNMGTIISQSPGFGEINVLIDINFIGNICFPANTPIRTNQGIIPIDKLDPEIHTIYNKPIVAITKTVTWDKYLVCFEKDALGLNHPTEKTIMSKHHKIYYKGKMIEAYRFKNTKKVKYTGEVLYNILMNDYEKININNLICETLHPKNNVAKLYKL